MDELARELDEIFSAPNAQARAVAWERFAGRYSALILKVCRAMGGDYDAAMDRYAYVLQELREDDFRRLRAFVGDGRSKVSTWLVVVTRRLCLDHHRQRYGRARSGSERDQQVRRNRRDLVDLVSREIDLDEVAEQVQGADELLEEAERAAVLEQAVAGLDPRDRLLLRLRFGDELPASEIARLLGLPTPFHVYRRVKQLLDTLRRSLRRAGIEDPIS